MKIEKIQSNFENYRLKFLYYDRARDAMFDLVSKLYLQGFNHIYIPGYIGWSPKEGSGIFDPLNKIEGLERKYYKMTKSLEIDFDDLKGGLVPRSIVLLVNYFGFRDSKISQIISKVHESGGVVIEDNAHGFYTYFFNGDIGADYTFFSLHKMFPFDRGGGLLVRNNEIDLKELSGKDFDSAINPFSYDIFDIARRRKNNYTMLLEKAQKYADYFIPLRGKEWLENNIPQTFPIIINRGNRDNIYELMNQSGFGVVSLYHTMIEELQCDRYEDAVWLSRRVMNLPIHQDCDSRYYDEMMEQLAQMCEETS